MADEATEASDDQAIDSLITGMQGMLNRLKSDRDDSGPAPKNLKEAGDKAFGIVKASRRKEKDQQ